MTAAQYSPFDLDLNWVGESRPCDLKAYWHSLSDTERAFERLEATDAAVFMEFYQRIVAGLPQKNP